MTWTRITDPETLDRLLPPWFGRRMMGLRGSFGMLLTTGDVLRVASLTAAHQSSDGMFLLDVLLDHAGVPDGIDLAWQSKHFLGAPVPGATLASVNLAQVVTVVEFTVAELAEPPGDVSIAFSDDLQPEPVEDMPVVVAAAREAAA